MLSSISARNISQSLQGFATARFGDRFTAVHMSLFAFLALRSSVAVAASVLQQYLGLNGLDPVDVDSLKMYNLQIDDLWGENEHTHQHLLIFALVARKMGLTSLDVGAIYPCMMAMFVPALWFYLTWRLRVPLSLATCACLYIWKSPLASHVYIFPNTDFLVTAFLVLFFYYLKSYRGNRVSIAVFFFIIMLTHVRAVVLVPALILWAVYNEHDRPSKLTDVGFHSIAKAAAPFLIAIAAFAVYKHLYYVINPAEMPLRRLDLIQQVRQLLRIDSAHNLEGGVFEYVLSPKNWDAWGLYYFTFIPLAIGARLKKDSWLLWVSLLVYLGSITQLLVAEDVHRLTGFLFINVLLLVEQVGSGNWPIVTSSYLFIFVGYVLRFQHLFLNKLNLIRDYLG